MELYSLEYPVKSFAVANEFVQTMNKVCYQLGKQLKPFCLFADEFQSVKGVADLVKFGGLANGGITLENEIVEYRKKVLEIDGEISPELSKTLFYHYLMSISICYVEVEKWKITSGVKEQTYDKYLCTRNPAIMGAWMGIGTPEMQAKYSAGVKTSAFELKENTIRFVKLNHQAKGNSITKPRSFPSTEGMRCIPLFMLNAWFVGVKEVLSQNIVKFVFLKDNHTERELCSTLSDEIIRRYYSDNQFINTMLSGVDIDQNVQGGMRLSTKINRGYVKLPELGSSIYDSTGTRSLNLARVLSAEVVDDIDTTFINVSLDSVCTNFTDCLEYCARKMPEVLPEIHKELIGEEACDKQGAVIVIDLSEWSRSKEVLLSTQFQRYLHKFMISHPEWFPLYSGTRVESSLSGKDYGCMPMDF